MSFVPNSAQQISLFDKLAFLSRRKQQMLENSWAQSFSDLVFTRINENIFAPLYSEKSNSRPNAPINVILGALILKALLDQTDDEIAESCEFDFRFQYALHTTSFETQPISQRTLSRFRARLAAYELATGEDLLHKCFVEMADEFCRYMEISPTISRMDSMMIESNIRKMGRLELLYTCLAKLVKELQRDGRAELIEGYEHYTDPNDRNVIIYHEKDTPYADRLQKVIDDACELLPKCTQDYADTEEYLLLERAITEQTRKDDDGHNIPKGKGDGMNSSSLQNPSDPDATFRTKAGKNHRGYTANITEAVDVNGSVVMDYQYDVNTRSDTDFLREVIENAEESDEPKAYIMDGAFISDELVELAAEKNIVVISTGLRGRKPREILMSFTMSKDEHSVISCPEGYSPKKSSYNEKINMIRVSFPRSCCENCSHCSECKAKLKARTAVINLSLGALAHTKEAIHRKTDETMKSIGRIRNGIETIPSLLRRKYNIDHMPTRGKLRTKTIFGLNMFAVNFTKLWLYERGLEKCRTFQPVST